MAEITARLEEWWSPVLPETVEGLIGTYVNGKIYDDTKGRWEDGHPVHTSTIMSLNYYIADGEIIITTRNSVYKLGKPAVFVK